MFRVVDVGTVVVEVVLDGAFTVKEPPSILAVLPLASTRMHLRAWPPSREDVLTSDQTVLPL